MRSIRSIAVGVGLVLATGEAAQSPITPAFAYQGQIKQNGALVNGPTTLRFSL